MNTSPPAIRAPRSSAGFSLVEVAIAVGIAALALVSILGILPSGLDALREAGNLTAEARVVSQVVGQIQLSDWGVPPQPGVTDPNYQWPGLQALLQQRWYFDDQANPISQQTSANFQMRLAFVAQARLATLQPVMPGATGPTMDLKGIIVDVAVTTNPNFVFNPNDKSGFLYRSHPAIVSRQFSHP